MRHCSHTRYVSPSAAAAARAGIQTHCIFAPLRWFSAESALRECPAWALPLQRQDLRCQTPAMASRSALVHYRECQKTYRALVLHPLTFSAPRRLLDAGQVDSPPLQRLCVLVGTVVVVVASVASVVAVAAAVLRAVVRFFLPLGLLAAAKATACPHRRVLQTQQLRVSKSSPTRQPPTTHQQLPLVAAASWSAPAPSLPLSSGAPRCPRGLPWPRWCTQSAWRANAA